MAETDYTGAHTGAEVDDSVGVVKGAGTGMLVKTGTGTGVKRTIVAGSAKLTVSNGSGVSGDPSVDFGSVASTDLSDTANLIRAGDNVSNLTNDAGYTDDQSGAEIKLAYEAESDTNAFTDDEKSKLSGIESGATADTPEKQDIVNITGTVAYARASHAGKVIRTSGATPTLNATSEGEIQVNDWFSVRQTDTNSPTVNLPSGATANGTPDWSQNASVYYHCVDATGGAYVFDLYGSIS